MPAQPILFEMETSDPDDFMTLLWLADQPALQLLGVVVTPGSRDQCQLVRWGLDVCGRADVYLSGHDHSLQWLTPTCNGTHLMVSGGGASATTNDTTNPVHYQTTDLGFLYVELNGRTFTGTFYGETGNVLFTRSFTK